MSPAVFGRLQRLLALVLVAACLSACSALDAEQDSLCRRTIPVLLDTAQGVRVTRSFMDDEQTVAVNFALTSDGREHVVLCRFAASGLNPRKRELTHIAVDRRLISSSALYYIRSRWLETQNAVAAEPAAASNEPLLGHAPRPVAYLVQQVLSGLPKMGIYALLAAAYALVFGLIGRIYLGFGALVALGGIVAIIAIVLFSGPLHLSVLGSLAVGALGAVAISALYGVVIARQVVAPLAARPGQQSLIASIGLLLMLEEFLRLSQGANARWLAPVFSSPLNIVRAGTYDATITPIAAAVTILALATSAALILFLDRSKFGREWRASADEPEAAEMFGVSRTVVLVRAFALASALAGLAGVMIVGFYGGIGFAGGALLGLTALVAAILGGIGSVGAAMTGGVIIGVLEALWSAYFPIEHKDVLIFALLAIMLALKPDGLFGGRQPGPMRV